MKKPEARAPNAADFAPDTRLPLPGSRDALRTAYLQVSPAVREALDAGNPVVALESTLITHGLPFPQNVETAMKLEEAVASTGAMPATIAVIRGKIAIGIVAEQLYELGRGSGASKLNLSNLASGLSSGRPGSTTVAATMYAAHLAGIRVFATGGIGGVHRGASYSFDISSDLSALSRIPVAVVCAGAKAILDLPKTVELLETLGVPVLGWKTDEFPAFYRRKSGLRIDARFDDMDAMARAVATHWQLGLESGPLICNPISPEHELPLELYERALATALERAEKRGITGREVTPFLLDAMREVTAGESVFSNTALLESNARVAGDLAGAL